MLKIGKAAFVLAPICLFASFFSSAVLHVCFYCIGHGLFDPGRHW